MADGGSARGMRGYFYALMTDRRHSPADVFLQGALWVLSLVYGAGVRILAGGYKKKFFFPYRADCKVISIGNITVGGTGKTPASLLIAKLLEAQGRRVAVLIRGYGADEYLMLQEELPECAILSGSDRITNARRAFYDFGADTVILDDGFQHWKIHRDLDIVLLDATNPFGNYRLLPRGILREPPQELTRADIIMLTKVDSPAARCDEAYGVIARLGKEHEVVEAVYRPLELYEIALSIHPGAVKSKGGKPVGLRSIHGKRIALMASIGNPGYFRQNLERLGAVVDMEFIFMDHYDYRSSDLYRIERECRAVGIETIVVTKKDAVKIARLALRERLAVPILVLDVAFTIVKNRKVLDEGLSRLYSR